MTHFMSFACRCENLMHYYIGSLSLLSHLFWPLVLHNKAVKVSITSEWLNDSDFAALHFNLHEHETIRKQRSLCDPAFTRGVIFRTAAGTLSCSNYSCFHKH